MGAEYMKRTRDTGRFFPTRGGVALSALDAALFRLGRLDGQAHRAYVRVAK